MGKKTSLGEFAASVCTRAQRLSVPQGNQRVRHQEQEMKIKSAIVLGSVLLLGTSALGQDNPKVELSIDYSYVHVNPQNNNIIKPFSLNGGGGAAAFFFNRSRATAALRTA
jgi:hypothetical protein